MAALLIYLIKSTICLTLFYLVFRWTLKKERLFSLNRILLLAILVLSATIPLVKTPTLFHQNIEVKAFPETNRVALPDFDDVAMQITTIPVNNNTLSTEKSITVEQVSILVYSVGFFLLLAALLIGLTKLMLLLFQTRIYRRKKYRLALVNRPIAPMSFGHFIIISKHDYRENKNEILNHEMAHIQFRHTYDLLMVELVKLFHWFNPFVYQLRNDLKEIQEFQVDRHLLNSGMDIKKYQLLLIKKCVGAERFALSNSFNHCQIKNRITMMNNQKSRKSNGWKVAIFLPVAALMLMAFGNSRSELPPKSSTPEFLGIAQEKKVWTENDFKSISEEGLKNRREKDFFNNLTRHNILMNRNSKIMMDGKVLEINAVKQQVQQLLDQSLSGIDTQNLDETKSLLKFILVILKDMATDESEYNKVLNIVGNSFSVARDKLANEKFNSGFESLNNENRKMIETIIPLNVFLLKPKQMSKKSETVPPPPPSPLVIKTDGVYLGDKLTLDELKKLIEFNQSDGSIMRFIVRIEEGVTQNKIEEIKQVLKKSEIVRIENSSKQMGEVPPPITIEIKETGIYCMNDLVSLERLKEIITKNIAMHPNQVVSLKVAPEVKMGEVTAVKEVLRKAGALHVNNSTDVK
jgi:beta-lactamase regulating signal transducer with metallopeptidase domain